jgi:hypothetical protein
MLDTMNAAEERRLRAYQAKLQQLTADLASTGFISSGSVVRRYTRCGKPGCRCQADPPQPHGPYWQWTTIVDGKTVTRRLNERQARLYQEWIANRRRLRRTIAEIERLSQRAADLLLKNAGPPTS